MDLISSIQAKYLKTKLPQFDSGDTVRVSSKIIEGDKERVQVFEGVVIKKRGTGTNACFTVRKISTGVGVEKVVPLHSPGLVDVELVKKGRVRRSKLYYLRGLRGRSARVEQRRDASASNIVSQMPKAEPEPEKETA